MDLNNIVDRVNRELAGEQLTFDEMKHHLDAVLDDINFKLNANFPAFSEFNNSYPQYPDYNFFPDKYIRSVVVKGAALYFFTTDEEGAEVAPELKAQYFKGLFYMERDYSGKVPEEYQSDNTGALQVEPTYSVPDWYNDMF